MLELVEREVAPDESILAVPGNSELSFLANRRNSLPYAYLPYGIRSDVDVDEALVALQGDPPRLVFYVPHLPYNTSYTERLMDVVRASYEPVKAPRFFEIYRRSGVGDDIPWTVTPGSDTRP